MRYLDFSPRNQDLATALARRFVQSLEVATDKPEVSHELQDQFLAWLAPKVQPLAHRGPSLRKFNTPFCADLRLVGLLDRYRAGGSEASSACPLFRVAYCEQE